MKLLLLITFFSLILVNSIKAQTVLNPGTVTFTTESIILTGDIQLHGTEKYLNIFWNASYSPFSTRDMGVACYLNCDPETQDCSFAQQCNYTGPTGIGGCAIINPSYRFYETNLVVCKFYDPRFPDIPYRPYPRRTFKPISFEVFVPSRADAVVGQEITVQVNIKNVGLLVDNYSVHVYTVSPLLAIDPLTALVTIGPINGISYPYQGEIGSSYVKMTLLATSANPIVVFVRVNSTTKPDIAWFGSVEITSRLSSLPDFSWFGIVQIMVIAVVILFILPKYSNWKPKME